MNYMEKEELRREFFENKMEEYQNEFLESLSEFFHPSCIDEISHILIFAWMENFPSAMKLADKLNLSRLHFIAILNNYEDFRDEFIKIKELEEGFDRYEE